MWGAPAATAGGQAGSSGADSLQTSPQGLRGSPLRVPAGRSKGLIHTVPNARNIPGAAASIKKDAVRGADELGTLRPEFDWRAYLVRTLPTLCTTTSVLGALYCSALWPALCSGHAVRGACQH